MDEEFLKLIELRDARLAKNARVEYIDGKRYEWAPGNVAGQRNSSLSLTFVPTPNFYDFLDNAVCTPSVPPSAGPNVNREQQKALALAIPTSSLVHKISQPTGSRRTVNIAGKRHPTRKGPWKAPRRLPRERKRQFEEVCYSL